MTQAVLHIDQSATRRPRRRDRCTFDAQKVCIAENPPPVVTVFLQSFDAECHYEMAIRSKWSPNGDMPYTRRIYSQAADVHTRPPWDRAMTFD